MVGKLMGIDVDCNGGTGPCDQPAAEAEAH